MIVEASGVGAETAEARAPRSRWHHMLMGLLVFSLLGPPIGGVLTVLGIAATEAWQGSPGRVELPNLLTLLGVSLVFSYPLGVVPAALTGLLVGWASPWLTGWRAAVAGALSGGAFTFSAVLLISGKDYEPGMLLTSALGAVPGALLAQRFFSTARGAPPAVTPFRAVPSGIDDSPLQ